MPREPKSLSVAVECPRRTKPVHERRIPIWPNEGRVDSTAICPGFTGLVGPGLNVGAFVPQAGDGLPRPDTVPVVDRLQHLDHSTFWRFYGDHRHAMRVLFERTVCRAVTMGLMGSGHPFTK